MQLSRSSILEVHLVPRGRAIHIGTLLPSAEAASCPQLAEGDIGALADRSGFDVVDGARSQQRGAIG